MVPLSLGSNCSAPNLEVWGRGRRSPVTAPQGGQGEPGGPLLGAGIIRVPETSQQGPLGRDDSKCRWGA